MKLPATLKKMNKRERYAIMLAVGVIGIFLVVTFIVEPFLSKTDQQKKSLHDKAVMLEQMRQLQSEYGTLTQKAEISKALFSRRQKGFKLNSFLVQLAGEAGVGRPYFCRVVRLGFLAPQIVQAILRRRHPLELTAKRLSLHITLPNEWNDQMVRLGTN